MVLRVVEGFLVFWCFAFVSDLTVGSTEATNLMVDCGPAWIGFLRDRD